jgi:hypothetical protein
VIRANSSECPAYAKLTMCLSRAVNYPGQLLGASCGPCSSRASSSILASSSERPCAQPTMCFSRAMNDLDQSDLQLRAVNASAWSNWSTRWDRRMHILSLPQRHGSLWRAAPERKALTQWKMTLTA